MIRYLEQGRPRQVWTVDEATSLVRLAGVAALLALAPLSGSFAAETAPPQPRPRRVLYNFDGCSCVFTKAGGKGPVPIGVDDVRRSIEEVAYEGSRVDTVLVCVNAQVMYYPTSVGTMLGEPPSKGDSQWIKNLAAFREEGVDPYAVMLAETRARGREALLSFRMNDDHGTDFQTTRFWESHPECRLGARALDFGCAAVRDHIFALLEECVRRYDCDGLELDFNRHPRFFKDAAAASAGVKEMNALVQRVRVMLDTVGKERGRRLVLSVRVPSNYNEENWLLWQKAPPTPASALAAGCDVPAWAANGWVDFVTVSELFWERGDLPIAAWRKAVPLVPVYGGIECVWDRRPEKGRPLSAADYRVAGRKLLDEGADGIYLFNFFTTREAAPFDEPPFSVLATLGDPVGGSP